MSRLLDAEELLEILTNGTPHREVYRGQGGGWFVTYGGGRTSAHAVDILFQGGQIHSVYSNCRNDAYHVGRTMDIDKTIAERKRLGSKIINIYVGDSSPYAGSQWGARA